MAENTRQRQGELMRGVFSVLIDGPEEGLAASAVLAALEERVPATPFENDTYPNRPTVRRYGRVVRFATIGPVKAGWLIKNKGQWTLTDEGRAAYAKFTDPEAFMREAARLYRAWKKGQPSHEDDEADETDAEDEAGVTFEESEEAARTEIREYLAKMPPYDFQDLVAALLKAMGYHVLWVAPPGPDRGIDMIAYTDPLGANAPRIKVQVKRTEKQTDAHGLRAFIGTLAPSDVGIYVSAGGFSSEAEREARSEQRHVTLIDLNRLVDLWIEHSAQLDIADRQRLPLKPIYFLAPRE